MNGVATFLIAVATLALMGCDLLQSSTPPDSETLKSDLVTYRQDLAPGVVVAFVEGLTPEMPVKVAWSLTCSGSRSFWTSKGTSYTSMTSEATWKRFSETQRWWLGSGKGL